MLARQVAAEPAEVVCPEFHGSGEPGLCRTAVEGLSRCCALQSGPATAWLRCRLGAATQFCTQTAPADCRAQTAEHRHVSQNSSVSFDAAVLTRQQTAGRATAPTFPTAGTSRSGSRTSGNRMSALPCITVVNFQKLKRAYEHIGTRGAVLHHSAETVLCYRNCFFFLLLLLRVSAVRKENLPML